MPTRSALGQRAARAAGSAGQATWIRAKSAAQRALMARGYVITTYLPPLVDPDDSDGSTTERIWRDGAPQSQSDLETIRDRHSRPVLGSISVLDLLEMLAQCIDPTDSKLGCASQLTHALQVAESLSRAGVRDEEMIVAALVHDLGKLLLLAGEAPSAILGRRDPIAWYPTGIGLDQCFFNWGHDDIVYHRLKDHLPDHLSWLVRYHSIIESRCQRLMDDRDRDYTERYLRVFSRHDAESKSVRRVPRQPLPAYRNLINDYFPDPVVF